MDMNGEARIPAPQAVVWDALNDPEALKAAITGCEELTRDGENAFKARVRAKVGPVSARFGGRVELLDLDPPHSYRIAGEGTGGAAGFAKGGAVVRLEADGPDATILKYDVDASVGGKLAQIGSRLIDGAARKMADDFFTKFGAIAAERATQAAPQDAAPPTPSPGEVAAAQPAAAPQQASPAAYQPSAPIQQEMPQATAPIATATMPRRVETIAPQPIRTEAPPAPKAAPDPAPIRTPPLEAVTPDAQIDRPDDTRSRPDRAQEPSTGMPGLMWAAGIGLVIAILLFTLMG